MFRMGLVKVISGGQTGADIGGLIAARLHNIPTGGWLPKGCKTQVGNFPQYLTLFNMQEHESPSYADRTFRNVRDSDATIRIAYNFNSPGEKCTFKAINLLQKPHMDIYVDKNNPKILWADVQCMVNFLQEKNVRILNVAGNSNRTWAGMQAYTTQFLSYCFMFMGFDRSKLPSEYNFLLPKGW